MLLGGIVKYLNWDAIHKLIKLLQMAIKEKSILPILLKQKHAKDAEKGELLLRLKREAIFSASIYNILKIRIFLLVQISQD